MPCDIFLRSVSVEGDWSPLMEQLPGWHPSVSGAICNEVQMHYESTSFSCTLEARTQHAWERVQEMAQKRTKEFCIAYTPSNLPISIYAPRVPDSQQSLPTYSLNHFALSVKDLHPHKQWWSALLGLEEVLHVQQGWDPLLDAPMDAIHFYETEQLYVTLRKESTAEGMHHMGFEVKDLEDLDYVRQILKRIYWPIIWEGTIDQSQVIHFEGPDSRPHDFFYTSSELRELTSSFHPSHHPPYLE